MRVNFHSIKCIQRTECIKNVSTQHESPWFHVIHLAPWYWCAFSPKQYLLWWSDYWSVIPLYPPEARTLKHFHSPHVLCAQSSWFDLLWKRLCSWLLTWRKRKWGKETLVLCFENFQVFASAFTSSSSRLGLDARIKYWCHLVIPFRTKWSNSKNESKKVVTSTYL